MFKRIALLFAALAFALPAFTQLPPVAPESNLSKVAGIYVSSQYAKNPLGVVGVNAPTGTGSQTYTLVKGWTTLPDGRFVMPWTVNQTVTWGDANQETDTITAVGSGCGYNQPLNTCQITMSVTYAHGQGAQLFSASNGFYEAAADAAASGGGTVYWAVDCGNTVLSTSSATNTLTCVVPKTFTTVGVSAYVTTSITTAVSYSLGISGHTAAFMTSCTSVTAGTNCSQFVPAPTALAAGTGTSAVLITMNATPGAGALHTRVWGYTMIQSSY
jgi:hypothetical protein